MASRHLVEVEGRLSEAATGGVCAKAEFIRRYHGSDLPHFGLSVPAQRRIFRQGYSFSSRPPAEQLPIWDGIWQAARHHETGLQAIYFCQAVSDPSVLASFWPVVRHWVERVEGWPWSDGLSGIYSQILEVEPNAVYPTLRDWTGSADPWKRRQSVVSLLNYSAQRRVVLPQDMILRLIEPLLGDPDRFVQKGVGWALREAGNVYPSVVRAFLQTNAAALSAIAFSAATEKLEPKFRDELKAARRWARAERSRARRKKLT